MSSVTSLPLHGCICSLRGILWTLTLLTVGYSSSCVTIVYSLSSEDARYVAWVICRSVNPKRQSIHLHLWERKRSDVFPLSLRLAHHAWRCGRLLRFPVECSYFRTNSYFYLWVPFKVLIHYETPHKDLIFSGHPAPHSAIKQSDDKLLLNDCKHDECSVSDCDSDSRSKDSSSNLTSSARPPACQETLSSWTNKLCTPASPKGSEAFLNTMWTSKPRKGWQVTRVSCTQVGSVLFKLAALCCFLLKIGRWTICWVFGWSSRSQLCSLLQPRVVFHYFMSSFLFSLVRLSDVK